MRIHADLTVETDWLASTVRMVVFHVERQTNGTRVMGVDKTAKYRGPSPDTSLAAYRNIVGSEEHVNATVSRTVSSFYPLQRVRRFNIRANYRVADSCRRTYYGRLRTTDQCTLAYLQLRHYQTDLVEAIALLLLRLDSDGLRIVQDQFRTSGQRGRLGMNVEVTFTVTKTSWIKTIKRFVRESLNQRGAIIRGKSYEGDSALRIRGQRRCPLCVDFNLVPAYNAARFNRQTRVFIPYVGVFRSEEAVQALKASRRYPSRPTAVTLHLDLLGTLHEDFPKIRFD